MDNVLQFPISQRTYSAVISPDDSEKEQVNIVAKENGIYFYAAFLYTFSCSSPEGCLKDAKNNFVSLKQMGNTFLLECYSEMERENVFEYFILNNPIDIDNIDIEELFNQNTHIEQYSLVLDESRFYTQVDDDVPYTDRKLFLMPEKLLA